MIKNTNIYHNVNVAGAQDPPVPPRAVLKKMFPGQIRKPACLHPISYENYYQLLSAKLTEYAARQLNLNASYNKTTFPLESPDRNIKPDMENLFIESNDFCFRMEFGNHYFGIRPTKLDRQRRCDYEFSLCNCNKTLSARFKKQMKYKCKFVERMAVASSPEFRTLRYEIERKVMMYYQGRTSLKILKYQGSK